MAFFLFFILFSFLSWQDKVAFYSSARPKTPYVASGCSWTQGIPFYIWTNENIFIEKISVPLWYRGKGWTLSIKINKDKLKCREGMGLESMRKVQKRKDSHWRVRKCRVRGKAFWQSCIVTGCVARLCGMVLWHGCVARFCGMVVWHSCVGFSIQIHLLGSRLETTLWVRSWEFFPGS